MCMLADNGNRYAIRRCNDFGIDYVRYLIRYGR